MLFIPLILLIPLVSAGPKLAGYSIPLTRRKPGSGDRLRWLRAQADALLVKYGDQGSSTEKRAKTGTVSLTNQYADVTYYGTVEVGTPGMLLTYVKSR